MERCRDCCFLLQKPPCLFVDQSLDSDMRNLAEGGGHGIRCRILSDSKSVKIMNLYENYTDINLPFAILFNSFCENPYFRAFILSAFQKTSA